IYYSLGFQYPKFFKMDNLCKAGFLGAELLMGKLGLTPEEPKRNWSVALMSRSGSLDDDQTYQQTIQSADNYFPSPAVFVYTLSNIVTGEIAIRHKIMGESTCYVTKSFDPKTAIALSECAFLPEKEVDNQIFGWCEYLDGQLSVKMFALSLDSEGALMEWETSIFAI
ncbi:MAG: hypothetical protein J6T67_05045, partial [Paludibacteraceae bacterium]|nr:hypothetical protein [Paludibacteraceae bacterium]